MKTALQYVQEGDNSPFAKLKQQYNNLAKRVAEHEKMPWHDACQNLLDQLKTKVDDYDQWVDDLRKGIVGDPAELAGRIAKAMEE